MLTIFPTENPDELCNKKPLKVRRKQGDIDTFNFNGDFVAIFDKLRDYHCITKIQHKDFLTKVNLKQLLMLSRKNL